MKVVGLKLSQQSSHFLRWHDPDQVLGLDWIHRRIIILSALSAVADRRTPPVIQEMF